MVGIQFIMTGAFSVLSPIMPLLLPELGVETASGVDLWAGVLNGVTSFVAAFASPVWGRVADRHGRTLMLVPSSLAIGVFTALMGVAANVWQFFAFRALMGVFAGLSSAAIALVASQVPEGRLGYSLGWVSTGQLVGSLAGPLIGGALADLTGSAKALDGGFGVVAGEAVAPAIDELLDREQSDQRARKRDRRIKRSERGHRRPAEIAETGEEVEVAEIDHAERRAEDDEPIECVDQHRVRRSLPR